MHTAISKVENSAQVLTCLLKFGQICLPLLKFNKGAHYITLLITVIEASGCTFTTIIFQQDS
jgi:hypothetical protein